MPEIRVLVTKQDFLDEGERMHHCIATYHNDTNHWFLHITTDHAETSLMISKRGDIVQHYGVNNCKASKKNVAVANRIAKALRKRK